MTNLFTRSDIRFGLFLNVEVERAFRRPGCVLVGVVSLKEEGSIIKMDHGYFWPQKTRALECSYVMKVMRRRQKFPYIFLHLVGCRTNLGVTSVHL